RDAALDGSFVGGWMGARPAICRDGEPSTACPCPRSQLRVKGGHPRSEHKTFAFTPGSGHSGGAEEDRQERPPSRATGSASDGQGPTRPVTTYSALTRHDWASITGAASGVSAPEI